MFTTKFNDLKFVIKKKKKKVIDFNSTKYGALDGMHAFCFCYFFLRGGGFGFSQVQLLLYHFCLVLLPFRALASGVPNVKN